MKNNRAAAEKEILSGIAKISPGNAAVEQYKARFAAMSDKDFQAFMQRLADGSEVLQITVPTGQEGKLLDIERNVELAKEWNAGFFTRLWMPADENEPSYLTPNTYFVVRLGVKIASQRLSKKASIPKTSRVINSLTGQPTGESKGASWSFPELRLAVAMGMKKAPLELMKYRGGDLRGQAALNASLIRTGHARLDVLKHFASGVVSTQTLSTFLTSAMIRNTLT